MQNMNRQPKSGLSKTIRYFLVASIPILLLVYLKPELNLPEVPLQVLVGNLLWVGFILLVAWKYYREIWKPKRRKKARLEAKEKQANQDQPGSQDQ